jgi:glycosyltransferase involved in cell wall biosynthesis
MLDRVDHGADVLAVSSWPVESVASDRVVLVHDYLLTLRGAERTFAALSDLYPDAPVVTLLYDEQGTSGRFAGRHVITSPLQRLGIEQKSFRRLLPLYSTAARHLPTTRYDCIVSSSSAFAHGVPRGHGAKHICYCHSPFRYAWHENDKALLELPPPLRPVLSVLLRRHRAFDRRAVASVDQFVANSEITRERIARFWGRDSVIVHPPVDVERFSPAQPEDYILFVGELLRHKRADVAIEAALRAGRPIKVVGSGAESARLRRRYSTAQFLGRVDDQELANLYARAAALIVPNVEEFGIAAIEAQAAGRPVVAIGAGGALETVQHERTGVLVPPGDMRSLADALTQDFDAFDTEEIRAHARTFSRTAFQRKMAAVIRAVRVHGHAGPSVLGQPPASDAPQLKRRRFGSAVGSEVAS